MKRTKKHFVMAALVLIASLSVVSIANAITWGEPDGKDHPYVGIVYFEQTSGIYRCSGTLLSPKVVLTAGHCTEEFGKANFYTWVSFQPEITFPADLDLSDDDAFKAYLNRSRDFVKGIAIPHPYYDDYSEFPNTYDVGLVILKKPVKMETYGVLPPLYLLDSLLRTGDPGDRRKRASQREFPS